MIAQKLQMPKLAACGWCRGLKFSARPRRSLRLGGEYFQTVIRRKGAEVAKTAQRKT